MHNTTTTTISTMNIEKNIFEIRNSKLHLYIRLNRYNTSNDRNIFNDMTMMAIMFCIQSAIVLLKHSQPTE